jgi:hypothetical protein
MLPSIFLPSLLFTRLWINKYGRALQWMLFGSESMTYIYVIPSQRGRAGQTMYCMILLGERSRTGKLIDTESLSVFARVVGKWG